MLDEKKVLEGPSTSTDPAQADADLDLLVRLFREYPADAAEFLRPLPVSEAYLEDLDTICSEQKDWGAKQSQSRLGFLNQFRKFRGLPIIAPVEHKGVVEEIGTFVDGEYRCHTILRPGVST